MTGTDLATTSVEHWLIIDRRLQLPAAVAALLPELEQSCGLDPATARQRLCGHGYALLARGDQSRLEPLREQLAAAGSRVVLLAPPRTIPAPRLLRQIDSSGKEIVLMAGNESIRIDAACSLVAVFADLSGTSVESHLRRLMTRNAYQGTIDAAGRDDETVESIVKGTPILDLYLLGTDGPQAAIRVLPGRFDPAGLGARKTLSAGRNLLALLDLLRSSGAKLILRSDCGLALLPGCQLRSGAGAVDDNLKPFTRFAWLAAHLQPLRTESTADDTAKSAEGTAAPMAEPARVAKPDRPDVLPPPPDIDQSQPLRSRQFAGVAVFALLAVLGFALARNRGLQHQAPRLFPFFFALLALIAMICALRAFLLKRRIENTPQSRIRSLATGMVEISGRAVRRYAVVAPQTGVNCVWYRLRRYRCDHRNRWQLIGEESSGPIPFAVADATGTVLVDPAGADIRPGEKQEGGDGAAMSLGASRAGAEKWVEETIPEGVTLYVLGFADLRRERAVTLQDRVGERLRSLKQSPELLQRFDADNDGRISLDEWEAARATIETEESRAHLQAGAGPRPQSAALVIGAPPQRRLPFVIAQSRDEAALVRVQLYRTAAWLATGTILAFCSLYLFFRALR